jgi:hypothetical protein
MVSESGDAIWSQKKRIRGIQYGPPPKKRIRDTISSTGKTMNGAI